jgi:hypothetical protein
VKINGYEINKTDLIEGLSYAVSYKGQVFSLFKFKDEAEHFAKTRPRPQIDIDIKAEMTLSYSDTLDDDAEMYIGGLFLCGIDLTTISKEALEMLIPGDDDEMEM